MTFLLDDGHEERYAHPWLAELVFALDARLRHRYQIIEYTTDPACILRIHVSQSKHSFELADGTKVRPGDQLLNVHLWNEHIPAVPAAGPTIAWARLFHRRLGLSVRRLAGYCAARPDDVVAIVANLVQATREQRGQLQAIMQRFGFEPPRNVERVHAESRLEAPLRRLGENILISAMVLAQNPVVLRPDSLWRVRTPVFVSRAVLVARFGEPRRSGTGAESA